MRYSTKRIMKTKDEFDKKGNKKVIEWGEYSLSSEITPDAYLDKVFESMTYDREKYAGKGRSCYYEFGTLDTETSKVWYEPDDKKLEHPFTLLPELENLMEGDLIRIDFIYFWQIDLNGIIGCGRSVLELAALLEKFSDRLLKNRFDQDLDVAKKATKNTPAQPTMFKIYGFNLPYDFQFIKKYINYTTEIGEEHHEMVVNTGYRAEAFNLQLIDAQLLVGNMSLKGALESVNVNIPKDGMDHSKYRDYNTKLNKRELGYCLDDVYYLRKFIEAKIEIDDNYNTVFDLPLTKTQEVEVVMNKKRREHVIFDSYEKARKVIGQALIPNGNLSDGANQMLRNKYMYFPDSHKVGKFTSEKRIEYYTYAFYETKLMRSRVGEQYNNPESCKKEYEMLRSSFSGGFTHANMEYLGKPVDNVICYDLCSDYPSEMIVNDYVYAYSEEVSDYSFYNEKTKELDNKNYGYLMHVVFHNFKAKRPFGTISRHKALNYNEIPIKNIDFVRKCTKLEDNFINNIILENLYTDNGRIYNADRVELVITDIDYNNMKSFYKWDEMEFIEVRRGRRYHLLPSVIDTIVEFYTKKCQLKIEEGKCEYGTEEYFKVHALLTLAKQKLNSIYGLSVKDKRKFALVNLEEDSDEYNNKLENFYERTSKYSGNLTYAIGVQVTAYARKRIFDIISNIPTKNFIYSDTDSVYVINNDTSKKVIEEYNKVLYNIFMKAVKKYNLPIDLWKKPNGENAYMCCYDADGTCDKFVTTGAKRYLKFDKKEDGYKVKVTVAGLNKTVGETYIKDNFKTIEDAIAFFTSEKFEIPKEVSKKKCHTYVEHDAFEFEVNGVKINGGSFVSLRDIPFTGSHVDAVAQMIKKIVKILPDVCKKIGIDDEF